MSNNLLIVLLLLGVSIGSCTSNNDNPNPNPSQVTGFEGIVIPEGFEFKTNQTISLDLNDEAPSQNAYYEIAF